MPSTFNETEECSRCLSMENATITYEDPNIDGKNELDFFESNTHTHTHTHTLRILMTKCFSVCFALESTARNLGAKMGFGLQPKSFDSFINFCLFRWSIFRFVHHGNQSWLPDACMRVSEE